MKCVLTIIFSISENNVFNAIRTSKIHAQPMWYINLNISMRTVQMVEVGIRIAINSQGGVIFILECTALICWFQKRQVGRCSICRNQCDFFIGKQQIRRSDGNISENVNTQEREMSS